MRRIKLKVIISLLLATILLGFVGCEKNSQNEESLITIGILYTEPHPVLTTIAEAFKTEVLSQLPDVKFIEKHGNGSKSQYPATVRAILAEGVDLLAPITTPMSVETLKQAQGRVPVVFLGVTDPIGAELVESLINPVNCSGVSDNPPMFGVINLVKQFLPDAQSIGIPYDPKDQPGVTTAYKAAALAIDQGLEANLRPVTTESELRATVRALAANVDAVVIGMDNLMMKNAGIISRTIAEQNIPLFAADDKSVKMGAIAGVGVDYADVGRLGGKIALEILINNRPVGEIPVKTLSTGQVFYNIDAASTLNIGIPESAKENGRATTSSTTE